MIKRIKDKLKEIWIELKFKFTSMYPSPFNRVSEQWLNEHKDD